MKDVLRKIFKPVGHSHSELRKQYNKYTLYRFEFEVQSEIENKVDHLICLPVSEQILDTPRVFYRVLY